MKQAFATPEGARRLIAGTGSGTFAGALGTRHGLYPVPKQLDLALLERIRAAVPSYVSLHGGSGTPEAQFRGAVERGISKININSELRQAYRTMLEAQLKAHPEQGAVVKLL